jgi:hypothetical protein
MMQMLLCGARFNQQHQHYHEGEGEGEAVGEIPYFIDNFLPDGGLGRMNKDGDTPGSVAGDLQVAVASQCSREFMDFSVQNHLDGLDHQHQQALPPMLPPPLPLPPPPQRQQQPQQQSKPGKGEFTSFLVLTPLTGEPHGVNMPCSLQGAGRSLRTDSWRPPSS